MQKASPLAFGARWTPAPVPPPAAALAAAGYPLWMAAILARRGVGEAAQAGRFLHPSLADLHDPGLLAGMGDAVGRLCQARARQEKVAVVGDYDADGVTATALLLAVLRACGLSAEAIVPHRLREGYGFQPVHVERARERGCGLIVTVDCGSSSLAGAGAARAAGIDVIVTDHHLPSQALPPGVLIVNPRQPGCTYPFPDLAGVGLALKLATALAGACGRSIDVRRLLRIAAIGTIADLVPLVGENRVIASLGLQALAATRSAGLKAAFDRAGIRPPYQAADIGFRIGPRLNAAGRLGSAEAALDLLLEREPERAALLAEQLETANTERQKLEAQVVGEASERVARRGDLPSILVEWSEAWHPGVVGIAAGRLAREFRRPTVLLSAQGGKASGSGRSVPGLHLHGFLSRWAAEMERFGGHAQAVGLTVSVERLGPLRAAWEEAAASEWAPAALAPSYEYELDLAAEESTPQLLAELATLEPHGQGNPVPLVRIGPLQLVDGPRPFGNGHLRATARGQAGGSLSLLGWGWAAESARLAGVFEALGHLERDRRYGHPVLRLTDARTVPGAHG